MGQYGLALALLAVGVLQDGTAEPPTDELRKRADEAIAKGLKYLASVQEENGSWSRLRAVPAITGLSVMAFLHAGHAPGEGPYGKHIEKGIRAVLKVQQPSGLLGIPDHLEMYQHGICTLMLAEALPRTRAELADECKKALKKAVSIIVDAQRKEKAPPFSRGGWRYRVVGNDSDMSVSVWQLAALRGARDAGCEVPQQTFDNALEFVRRSRDAASGGYRYTVNGGVTIPCTASAVIALVACGQKLKEVPEAHKAGVYILRASPAPRHVYYSYHHCSQAMFQLGGNYWQTYRPKLFEEILKAQHKTGAWTDTEGYGPHYSTAMAILALTVETRTEPAPKQGEKPDGK